MTRTMMPPRGLTLLEVLIATVLLSVMIAVCFPFLRTAGDGLQRQRGPEDLETWIVITRAADEHAALLSIDATVVDPDPDSLPVLPPNLSPDTLDSAFEMTVLESSATDVTHRWLVVELNEQQTLRWLPPPPPSPDVPKLSQPEGGPGDPEDGL